MMNRRHTENSQRSLGKVSLGHLPGARFFMKMPRRDGMKAWQEHKRNGLLKRRPAGIAGAAENENPFALFDSSWSGGFEAQDKRLRRRINLVYQD